MAPKRTRPRTGQKVAKGASRGGAEARARAMALLVEGLTLSATARTVGVNRKTVREWRDSRAGQAELAAARRARAVALGDVVGDARALVAENVVRAVQTLVDRLDARMNKDAIAAAQALLDRGGLSRTERLEIAKRSPVDLSKLSDAEFAEYRALRAKARAAE